MKDEHSRQKLRNLFIMGFCPHQLVWNQIFDSFRFETKLFIYLYTEPQQRFAILIYIYMFHLYVNSLCITAVSTHEAS